MNFEELLKANNVSVREVANWCCLSTQQVYNYCNGKVHPKKLSYCAVTDIATYLHAEPDVVYNCMVESFESCHEYSEEKGDWI